MASTNLIYAVPTANSSVSYELPANDSAQLSFSPSEIDGLKMDANGGLVISFTEGGNVTLSNFQSFIDNGNTLSLADGTEIDPKLLFNALGGEDTNPFAPSDALKIGIPADGETREISLESGKKYLFNFDLSETQGADVKDGKMVISFANGGKIVIPNYETAMAGEVPPELSLASKTCVVTGDELITNIQALAKSGVVDPTAVEEEKEEDAKAKSKIADADMEGKEDIGPGDQTAQAYKAAKVEPAAGEETASAEDMAAELAAIETAAGGAAGGARNSGYGIGSRPGYDPFITNPDIGPIDPTQLRYRAPLLDPSRFIDEEEEQDGNPIAGNPNTEFLDETNLSGGPISVSDTIQINFGADGVGSIQPNGEFVSFGSKTGGDLSSNGVDIVVSVVGNGYVGMAGDVKVFELVVDPETGDYTFTQYEQLDHADGSDPNDQISLKFGITAKDGDGDAVKTSVTIVIADDAPTISGDEKTIDETTLGPITVNGTLAHDFGQDGAGKINTNGSFTATGSVDNNILSSSGVAIVVTSTATGYAGMAGAAKVFELTIDPETGDYSFTQYKNIDHADNNDANDIITLTFGTKIVDFDGDTDSAPVIINIKDDAPTVCDECGGDDGDPKFTNVVETVDETNLTGPVVETGTLVADFGADVPGSYSFKTGDFQSGGSKLNGQLTHEGNPVVVSIVGGQYVGVANGVTVFTLSLNPTTGDYTFTLLDNFDHADASNPDDVITLDFGVLASDFEGDSIEGNIRINVKDDAPVANDDVNTYDTTFGVANGNVISGLNGGAGAADDLSTDHSNKVVKIAFGGNEVDVPASGTVSIDGDNGTLTIAADGTYTYQAFVTNPGGTPTDKSFVGGTTLPDFDESQALDGIEQQSLGIAPGNLSVDEGDVITVNFVSEVAGYSNSLGVFTVDSNGNLKAEKMLIANSDSAGGPKTYTVGADAASVGFFMIANGAQENNNYAGIDFSAGTLNFVYNYGQPGARDAKATDDGSNISLVFTSQGGVETVLSGPLYFTSDRGGVDNLNSDDSVRVVSGLPDENDSSVLRIGFEDLPQLGDQDYNDLVFDISIKDKDCGCGPKDIRDQFTYTLQDGDGDRDTATLTLSGKDLTDDKPIFAAPGVEVVDETNLSGSAITETGSVGVDFGHDGPGTVAGNGSFTSGGSKLNGNLTSGGVAVIVTLVNGTYVGKAGSTTVFTMKIEENGQYTFKLFEQLDHADGNNPNDEISLNFGIKATDCDGDVENTTVTVKVKDDAPIANNDSRTVDESQTITGNVTNNDNGGQDTPATVTKVTINGNEYIVPNSGTVVIPGTYGTLTIDKTGQYSYTANSNNPDGTDNFTYTLKDNDGDTDTAVLCIDVCPKDDQPIIAKPADEIVDETNLSGGVITETGTVTANFGTDTPGNFSGNNSFTSGGSRANNVLSHNGTPVVVNFAGGTYTGTAGGVTVFTMKINSNGSYEFKLFEQLDHADGSNPNDIITLDFGVTATDSDGDVASTTITVKVKDDAPVANDDSRTADEGQTITGNVTNNDQSGQDTPAIVTKVVFNGTTYDVPNSGNVVIPGTYGTLTIDKTGQYSYTAKSNNPDGTDNFTYTLKDNDGDIDTAVLCIQVSPNDDCPIIVKPADEIVDETNLSGGVITETGSVSANFFSDGPGSIAGNGAFTSSGSRANNALMHNGAPIVVSFAGGIYTGMAGSVKVFTMQIGSNGSYEFKLFEQLDHADGNNPNDIINLDFGVTATDVDGDAASTTITVKVKDDAPIANDDHNTSTQSPATGNVITGQNGGPGAADVLSQDVTNKVVKVSFGGTTVDVPSSGTATIEGANGTLKIAADGSYTYTAKAGANSNGEEKTFVGGATLPDFDESEALDGVERQSLGIAPGNLSVNEGDVISIRFVGEQADYSNTLGVFTIGADGKLKAETILIKDTNNVSVGTHSYTVANDGVAAGFFIIADGADMNNNYAGIDFSKGTLDFVYNYGISGQREATINDDGAKVSLVYTAQNGTKTVLKGPIYYTTDRGDLDNINVNDETRVVSGLPNQNDNTVLRIGFEDLPKLGDKDFNDVVFDISITNPDCGCDNSDVFTYTLQDKDGDKDTATLTLDCVEPPYTPVNVHVNMDDACVKEDSNVNVPVTASFTNGSGNETMTLTLTGVASGWKITATGWTNTGNGTYTLTLPKGQSSYSGNINFKPPANSDVDLNGLQIKASVFDPDNGGTKTATDGSTIIVDAVIDPFKFSAEIAKKYGGVVFDRTMSDGTRYAKLTFKNLSRNDADGSESLKKIVFTLQDGMDDTTYISYKNGNTLVKVGTQSIVGNKTVYEIDLSAMTYDQAKTYISNLYLTNVGKNNLNSTYNLDIQIVSYEKNLGGVEKDYSDNETSYAVCLPIKFSQYRAINPDDVSPLVIDLDRDGIELISKEDGVRFDVTNDGVKDQTGWVKGDDGLVALDKNGDGLINDRSELFGNDGDIDNGFDNLAQYDGNADGLIDAQDAVYADLRVWQDLNKDGVSQSEEMKTLSDLNIAAIKLKADNVSYDIAGNAITDESQVVYTDGSTSQIVDAWFKYQDGLAEGVDKGLTLRGGIGADVISGTGAVEDLYGGAGADLFLFGAISEGADTVKDFSAAEGDKLDLSEVLTSFDPVTDAISDFVFANVQDGNTVISVNAAGTGEAGATQVAVLENVNVSVSDLFNNGNIVV